MKNIYWKNKKYFFQSVRREYILTGAILVRKFVRHKNLNELTEITIKKTKQEETFDYLS